MRTFLLVAAAAALLPMSLVTACGGSSSSSGDDDGQVTPTGPHTHFVANTVAVPTTSVEATMFGLDIGAPTTDKPDGTVDNQLGSVLAALKGQGFDVTTTLNTAVNSGSIILLVDFQSSDPTFMSTPTAGLQVLLGDNPVPAPCDGSSDTTCGHQFMNGSFGIGSDSPTDAVVAGPIVGGTFSGGPGSISLQLALGGTQAITLQLQNARAKATGISTTGITQILIGGAISTTDIDGQVIPAIVAQLGPIITRDCPYATTTNNCECDQCQAPAGAGSAAIAACIKLDGNATACAADTTDGCIYDDATTGHTILGLFDTSPMDCMVTTQEVLGNQLIKSLLAPDVCTEASCAMPDALSLGIKLTAVPATYTVAGEGSN